MQPDRESSPRGRRTWILLVLAIALVGCSDSGGRRGGPTAPGPSPSVFTLGADLRAEAGVGILEVTVLLDGRDIGGELSHPTEADDHAVVSAAEPGIEPGPHVVLLRFDRLGSSPARIEVIVGGSYAPPGGAEPRILFQERQVQEVVEGEGLSFEFEI